MDPGQDISPREGVGDTLGRRLFWTISLNGSAGLLIAVAIWFGHSHENIHSLPTHLWDSLIHSAIYGITFGMAMPYLAERWSAFRFPWSWMLVIASLLALAVITTMAVQTSLLTTGLLTRSRFWPEWFYKSITVFLIALVIAVSVWGYEKLYGEIREARLNLRTQQWEKERALSLLTEARLNSLESKLHPHFLFNTLNSISALIPEQPNLAEEMIQRLAALLRISLDSRARNSITLQEEIKLVLDYCEIEKIRFGRRLAVEISIPPNLEYLAIPPMILQPLVENSIKYAVSPVKAGGRIVIGARHADGKLLISVFDNGPGFSPLEITPGHSIDNLRSRLIAMFPEGAGVTLASRADGHEVIVSLPLEKPKEDEC
jgi:sensor histidine kinase YesM